MSTARIVKALSSAGFNAAGINIDGWLNLPQIRFTNARRAQSIFSSTEPEEMFSQMVLVRTLQGCSRPTLICVSAGSFVFTLGNRSRVEYRLRGEFRDVTPPAKLVYTWQWRTIRTTWIARRW